MQNKEILVGLGILGIVAYLRFRSKGSNSILENKFEKANELENIKGIIDSGISKSQLELSNLVVPTDDRNWGSLSNNAKRSPYLGTLLAKYQEQKTELSTRITELGKISKSLNLNDLLKL